MLEIQREIWTVSCKLGVDSVTGIDAITLDADELSLLWPLSSQEEEWKLDQIVEAVQTGDSTWGLRDTSAGLVQYIGGVMWKLHEQYRRREL